MIWESEPWKRALMADVRRLDRLRAYHFEARKMSMIERTLFTAGFSVRKLMEAHKLTDAVCATTLVCAKHSILPERTPNALNWQDISRFYDLDNSTPDQLSLRQFCNLLVHSFVFVIATRSSAETMDCIYITSDKDKHKFLLCIEYEDIRALLTAVAEDEVVSSQWRRAKDGQFKIVNLGVSGEA